MRYNLYILRDRNYSDIPKDIPITDTDKVLEYMLTINPTDNFKAMPKYTNMIDSCHKLTDEPLKNTKKLNGREFYIQNFPEYNSFTLYRIESIIE